MNSRVAIGLCAAAFVVFSFLCITTHAPMIEQDIASRCREALTARQIAPDGLSVSGRDVILSGSEGSPLLLPQTRILLQRVAGVRSVNTRLVNAESYAVTEAPKREESGNLEVHEVQEKINAVLLSRRIQFAPNSAALTASSKAALDAIVPILAQASSFRCEIRANSTASPDAQHEWMVTLQRALATEDYLVSKGIADWHLSAQVFRVNGSPNAALSNRQIDFVVKER